MSTATSAPPPAPSAPSPGGNMAPNQGNVTPHQYSDEKLPSGSEAFDQMFSAKKAPEKEATKEPEKKPEPEKPTDKEPKSKVSLDDGMPEREEAKGESKPAEATKEPKGIQELRTAYEGSKKAIAEREAKIADLEAKIAAGNATNGELTKYESKIKELQAQIEERETKLKFADYSSSEEYSSQYLAPLQKAINTAAEELPSFTIGSRGDERQASYEDLAPLLGLKAGDAWKKAREVFGDAAPAIMRHRDQIVSLNQKRAEALEEFKIKGVEQRKQQEEMTSKQRQELAQRVEKSFDDHISSRARTAPELYGPDSSDPEVNKLLESGRRLVDIAFKGAEDVSEEDMVKIQGEVAARAMALGRMVYANKKLQSKVAELEKKLKGYEKSEPSSGDKDSGKVDANPGRRSWEDDFNKIPTYRGR